MLTQIHLKGKRFSGRGVKLRALDPLECEDVFTSAAKVAGKEATFIELHAIASRNGVKRFVAEITEPVDTIDEKTKWKKVSMEYMDEHFQTVFTPKDIVVLEKMYRDFHDVSQDEVDAIVGKAIPVASED